MEDINATVSFEMSDKDLMFTKERYAPSIFLWKSQPNFEETLGQIQNAYRGIQPISNNYNLMKKMYGLD